MLQIVRVREVVGADRQGRRRIGAGQPDVAAALRAQVADVQRVAFAAQKEQIARVVAQLAGAEVELQVGPRFVRRTARNRAAFGAVGRKHAAPGMRVAHQIDAAAQDGAPGDAVRHGPRAGLHKDDVEMILQILADAGKMVSYFDASLLQLLAVANAGEHQEARALNRAC